MKCPICDAWTDTLETRTRADGTKRRRYECANGHRFSTLETFYLSEDTRDAKLKADPARALGGP